MSLLECLTSEIPLLFALYFMGILLLALYNSKIDQKIGYFSSFWRVLTGRNGDEYFYYFVEKLFLIAFCFFIGLAKAENCAF